MLIVKNGQGELVAKSDTSAAELGSSLAFASMGVFHGLAALNGRHAPFAGGGGTVGGGAVGGGAVGGGSATGGAPQPTPFTVKDVGIAWEFVTVPRRTMFVVSPGAMVEFHSPGVTFMSALSCLATPFH